MSKYFYFEPTQEIMTEFQVKTNIGQVTDWHESRLNEIGLFVAYHVPYPVNYNRFTLKSAGSVWNRVEANGYGVQPGVMNEYPVYVQNWLFDLLTTEEKANIENLAKSVVAEEIEKRLTSISTWASARHLNNTSLTTPGMIKTIISELFALNNNNSLYPFELANSVENGTFDGWPQKYSALELQAMIDPQ